TQFAPLERKRVGPKAHDSRFALSHWGCAGASQHRGNSQQKFTGLERLCEVIVHADLEPSHAISRIAASGKHENRDLGARAKVGCEIKTVLSWHHHVEHNDVE